ncbi:prolipoprotein diacylglyceryl transferase [uncultured Sneathiella sp.]|uniref:prolipoprotein diacylglyceryl transferase n=1 Tax=uncultured Sneathiella sp. TaxID=879315 RepID=UPI0030DBA886|tara:strand:- start:213 stop:1022 length:810 start_codon:yes stop_codon:yes gene_type:complete
MMLSTLFAAIAFPEIDPVIFQIGPFAIRWYALAYIVGLIIGWQLMMHLAREDGSRVSPKQVDDFLIWATLGVILGGRLGYVLFYKPEYYFANPSEIFMVWQGGMSFHGGFLGVVLATVLYCRFKKIVTLDFGDLLATVVPVGLFFGRIANFINGELYGRATDVPWGMVFPGGGDLPRHPSQLYEAFLEGLVLFAVLLVFRRTRYAEKPGFIMGLFFAGYAVARSIVELYREPDAYLGFLIGGATMGQLLSLPILIVGLYFMFRPSRKIA